MLGRENYDKLKYVTQKANYAFSRATPNYKYWRMYRTKQGIQNHCHYDNGYYTMARVQARKKQEQQRIENERKR